MISNFFKNYSIQIGLYGILILLILSLVFGIFYINSIQRNKYNFDGIEVLDYQLPTLDLEKFKQLDKINLKF